MNFMALYQTIAQIEVLLLIAITVNSVCVCAHCMPSITWQRVIQVLFQ